MYSFKKFYPLKSHLKYAVFKETILIEMQVCITKKVDTLFDVIVNCNDHL